jgi:hypothetical protein
MRRCEEILADRLKSTSGRLLLLPIPTTRDNQYISSTDVSLSSVTNLINEKTVVAGYGLTDEILYSAEQKGAICYDASHDEDFLLQNARLTANGAVGYILTHTVSAICDLHIGIVGYGRIGRELLRLLLMLGSCVTLYTARREVAMELCEMGVDAKVLTEESDLSDLDILLNTTPKKQIDEAKLSKKTDIIDLASGSIFEPSARLIKLSSIPEAFYPESAGRIYATGIINFLTEAERL